LEREHRHAKREDAGSQHFTRLQQLVQQLVDTDKALVGLSDALKNAETQKRPQFRQKRETFHLKRKELEAEHAALVSASPTYRHLLRVEARLRRLRAAIGLDREEARLRELQREQGRRSGRSGKSFEEHAANITRQYIIGDTVKDARLLRCVTLGAARTELDQVVVHQPRRQGPVDVLAVVEVKRNINDLGSGFRQRQENLAWLTGDTAHYDAALYRTRHFRSGHFDRDAVHQQDDETFVFDRSSFRHFRREPDTGLFLNDLYLITRHGDLWGLSSANLRRIQHRIATDEHWELDSDEYMERLFSLCNSLRESMESPDVLRTFIAARKANQVLVVSDRTKSP
jgi:hypothetical protein